MHDANATQVGGDHYRKLDPNFQHWDMAIIAGNRYLESAATKYIVRWRDKNGIADLRKALHYVDKLLEKVDSIEPPSPTAAQTFEIARFMCHPAFDSDQRQIVFELHTWSTPMQVARVRVLLERYLAANDPTGGATPAYVNQG
jgi:hypothetical protein